MRAIHHLVLMAAATLFLAASTSAQGVEVKSSATILFGAPSMSSQPAKVRLKTLRKATPEWQTIRSEGIRKGSARHSVLMNAMTERIKRACAEIAEEEGRDCVVESGDITDDRGLDVVDLTSKVRDNLESEDGAP